MALWKKSLLGAVLLLGGCSFVQDSLLPTLTGERPGKSAPATTEAAARGGAANARPAAAELGKPTGTAVGQKVDQIRLEVGKLDSSVNEHNGQAETLRLQTVGNIDRYQQLVAGINAKLQAGTTPGNPALLDQWNQAQAALDKINGDVTSMNALSSALASDSSTATDLLEQMRTTYELSGAVDEDHHQLALLDEEVKKARVTIDRLRNELAENTSRQSQYLPRERRDLETLAVAIKNGELLGGSLADQGAAAQAPRGGASKASLASRRPLVVIRFDRPDVEYEQALYRAVSAALQRKPDVDFDVVAIAPTTGNASQAALAVTESKRNADAVMRSLANMGLPASRITLSSTTSATAATSEVHLYVR